LSGKPSAEVVLGRRPTLEALAAGVPVHRLLVAKGVSPSGVLGDILRLARASGTPVSFVERSALDRYGDHHQGVVAVTAGSAYWDLADLLAAVGERALLFFLDGVTDPHNFGAIARSAEAFGAAGLVIPARRSAGSTPAAMKASAGALLHLPVARVPNLSGAIAAAKAAGFWVVAAEPKAPKPLWAYRFDGRQAVIIGSEGKGVSPLVRRQADDGVSIPLVGRVASLNASVAAALVLYEWARQAAADR
jgi:23S rRNA (guanosine2251-2'-O)-methyltransferase